MSTSSRTPSNETAKTKSARKTKILVALAIAAAILLTALLLAVFNAQRHIPTSATLHAGGKQYSLQVAATAQVQEKGLGGGNSMPRNSGMLFWFADDQTRCFWMKDMHFSLDIIWLDANHRVTHIEPRLSPQTYPNTFCPAEPARYVIELNSGEAARAGIRNGETLTF